MKINDASCSRLLPDIPAQARRTVALDHLRKCLKRAERFAAALDAPAKPPEGVEIYLFAGDAEPTESVVLVDRATGRVSLAEWAPGDGTVLRSSAMMDERLAKPWTPQLQSPITWRGIYFLFTDHLGTAATVLNRAPKQ